MDIDTRILRVPPTQINFEDDSYRLRPLPMEEIPASLLASINRTGILHPPVLKEEDPGSFVIVDGRLRLRAAFEVFKLKHCPCLVLPEPVGPADALAFALETILLERRPTPVEIAFFFRKIADHLDEENAAQKFLPLFNINPNVYNINRYFVLLQLEEPLLLALHDGLLDENAARELAGLPFMDRMALFDIIEHLRLSVSNQKKLIRICHELARRRHTDIVRILGDPAIKEIIQHPQANAPQKTANLLNWLTRQRYPRLSAAEQEFHKFVGRLNPGKGINVEHSPAFEKDEVTLKITFANRDLLGKAWPEIHQAMVNTKA